MAPISLYERLFLRCSVNGNVGLCFDDGDIAAMLGIGMAIALSPASPGPGGGRFVSATLFGLKGLDILQSVENAAADLQINRSLAKPAPALQCPGAQAPAAREINLV
jgi:hypothetical protein